jgi:inner membrane protein
VKLLVVCVLAVSMTIPGIFVGSLVEERTARAGDVIKQISGSSGGQQTFLGPTLIVPYKDSSRSMSNLPDSYVVFPATASAVLKTATEERRRSLFKVPVFHADLKFEASFDLTGSPSAPPPDANLDWQRAEIVVGVTDVRGALDEATLTTEGNTTVMVPAQALSDITLAADHNSRIRLTLLGARIGEVAKPNAQFQVTSAMRFSGAQRVAVLSYGKRTQVSAQGDWPNPGFDGGFLPSRRKITTGGYTVEWSIPFIARGVRAEGPIHSITGLEATDLGTTFVEVADPYQSVNRCLKYVLLFLGLIFLSYFVLEVANRKRIHPAQYILVGVVQIIFYLLLLSLAERIGFDWAFAVAGACTVALLSTNAGWVFSSRTQGLRALVTFTLLYVVIFGLLRAEDYALLIGAITSFVIVAITMYLTRKIDWYSPLAVADGFERPITPASPDAVNPQAQ